MHSIAVQFRIYYTCEKKVSSFKRSFRDLSDFNSKFIEHHTRNCVCKFKMSVVWPSIAEGFPTACSQVHLYNTCDKYLSARKNSLSQV